MCAHTISSVDSSLSVALIFAGIRYISAQLRIVCFKCLRLFMMRNKCPCNSHRLNRVDVSAMSIERTLHSTKWNSTAHHHHCCRRHQPPITVHLNGMTMFSSINNGCAHKSIRQLQKRVNRPNDKCFSAHGKNYREITSASLEIGISEIWE